MPRGGSGGAGGVRGGRRGGGGGGGGGGALGGQARMDASITTADYDFPAPQRTGNSCNLRMQAAIKNRSIHIISDFPTGMRSPPCFQTASQSLRIAREACGA